MPFTRLAFGGPALRAGCFGNGALRAGLALSASLFLTTYSRAVTVGGPVVSNTTWTAANSPYIVTAAIIVGGGATLTIEPGVTVKFDAGFGIAVGSAAFGNGALRAIGTSGQRITFTSNAAPAQPGQWKDIQFTDFAIDAAFDEPGGRYLSGSVLQHCIVEYAGSGMAASSGAVTITESSPFINFCEIRNTSLGGIYAGNSPQTPTLRITNSYMHDNSSPQGGGGAYLSVNEAIFTGNTVSYNTSSGGGGGGGVCLYLTSSSGSDCTFSNNTISNNTDTNCGGGVSLHLDNSATCTFSDNTVSNNTNTNCAGGVCLYLSSSATCTFSGNTVSSNTAIFFGGGVWLSNTNATCILSGNAVSNNSSITGGGIYYWGSSANQATISGNTITNNRGGPTSGSGSGLGGGVYLYNINAIGAGLAVSLTSNSIIHNEAHGGPTGGSGFGGGVYVAEFDASGITTVNLAGDQVNRTFNVISGNTADFGDAICNNMLFRKDGSNDIHAEYVCWGGQDPSPAGNPDLIWDFFNDPQKAFVIYSPHVTDPDCVPVCPGDANNDGQINFADITSVLENWGVFYPASAGPGDANRDGAVNFADITKVLENWGVACP